MRGIRGCTIEVVIVISIIGQFTYIASYVMRMILSKLHTRHDTELLLSDIKKIVGKIFPLIVL